MDKVIKTLTGGHPLEWDDLEYDENGILDAFEGLGAGVIDAIPAISNSFVLAGCTGVINVGNIDISAGWIFYNGEVVKVEAHSIVDQGGGAVYWFKLEVTNDPAGLETFEDTIAKDTYEVRRMVLTNDALEALTPPVFGFDYVNMKSLTMREALNIDGTGGILDQLVFINATQGAQILKFLNIESAWTEIDLSGLSAVGDVAQNSVAFGTGTNTALPLAIGASSWLRYKIVGKTVYLQFQINGIALGAGTVANSVRFFNMPFASPTVGKYQTGFYKPNPTAALSGVTGMVSEFYLDGANGLVFTKTFINGAYIAFNKLYDLDAPGSGGTAGTEEVIGAANAPLYDSFVGGGVIEIA